MDQSPIADAGRLQVEDLEVRHSAEAHQAVVGHGGSGKVEEIVPAAATPGATEPEVIKKEKATEEGAEGEAKGGEKKEAAPKKEEKK